MQALKAFFTRLLMRGEAELSSLELEELANSFVAQLHLTTEKLIDQAQREKNLLRTRIDFLIAEANKLDDEILSAEKRAQYVNEISSKVKQVTDGLGK